MKSYLLVFIILAVGLFFVLSNNNRSTFKGHKIPTSDLPEKNAHSSDNNPSIKISSPETSSDQNKIFEEAEEVYYTNESENFEQYKDNWISKAKKLQSMEEGESYVTKSFTSKDKEKEARFIDMFDEFIEQEGGVNGPPINTNSEQQRRNAYELALKYLKNSIPASRPDCRVVSHGYYHPILVSYYGQGIFKVRVKLSFDCDQDYINKKLFTLTMQYFGNNRWDATLTDQRFLD